MGLRAGAQIVIGTPGRVMDHMRRGTLRLETVKMVILDEADVMLNMGFRDDIELILKAVPKERQTVFFCATMPRPILDLIQTYARDPQNVRIQQKTLTVPTVDQVYYEVDRRYKVELLTRLIDIHDLRLGIIFCNTKAMVDDLVDHLEAQGYSADRLHGDMTQGMRDRVMNKFRQSGLEFLVATDVAARGIDVDDVQVVFNYDLPYDVEDYVHRIGRTGRTGRSGRAISFVSGRELFQIRNIERYTNARIQRLRIPTRDEVEEARANVFLDKLRATLQAGEFKRQDHLIERLLEEGFSSTDIASALLHHLQGGDAPPATTPPPAAEAPRPAPREERAAPRLAPAPRRPERPVLPSSPAPRPAGPPRPPWAPPAASPKTESRPVSTNAAGTRTLRSGKIVTPPPAKRVTLTPRPAPPTAPVKPAKPAPTPAVSTPTVAVIAPPPEPVPAPAAPEVTTAPETATVSEVTTALVEPNTPPPPPAPAEVKTETLPVTPTVSANPKPVRPAKPARRVEGDRTRIHMNIGEAMGVAPGDIIAAIMGETGLPAQVVGTVDLRERHLFVEVAADYANGIIAKLNRTQIKGHKLKVKLA